MSDIDFVIMWVDSNDPEWQKSYSRHKALSTGVEEHALLPARFRDMNIFKYWFRSVEAYAPWVRKIHLITCGQVPGWLNLHHEKINIVNHSDIMDEKHLPTFSSRAIEVNIHKINGLSEKFVFFNDDMMLNAKVSPSFYFSNNLPNDFLIDSKINPTSTDSIIFNSTLLANTSVVNTFFDRAEIIKKNKAKYFSYKYGRYLRKNFDTRKNKSFNGFLGKHLPQPFLKSTFEEVWAQPKIKKILERTVSLKFREGCCLNQYVFRYWQLAKGEFNPCNPKENGVCYHLNGDKKQLSRALNDLKSDVPQICLNDCFTDDIVFANACNEISRTLDAKLDKKSSFELSEVEYARTAIA